MRVAVQYGLLAGPLLSMVDSSIVNVAVAPIARELHTSIGTAQWAVSGYLLALGTGLAGTAWLARRFGTVGVYRASLIAFTVASAACAFAPDATGLVAARIVQGLVAAPLVPPPTAPSPYTCRCCLAATARRTPCPASRASCYSPGPRSGRYSAERSSAPPDGARSSR